ncbi:MAG: T9SS type A sorting domain-containing protein, partial [Bacteroidales bacterium]|nr:T9SS type A sorting domain-containing protein [Bacteroidales bacterium]
SIEFRSDNGLLVSFASPAEVDTTILMTLYTDKYVYIRAIQEDGDYVWSAPVYLSGVITGISDAMQIKIPVYTVLNRDNTVVIHSTQVVENAQIQLIDVSGRVHFSSCISLCADKDFTFGVANLQDGVYIVTITHPSHTLITKILIQR